MTLQFSPEQDAYISDTEQTSTKLLACPGSGKTFCILHRMQKLMKLNGKQSVAMVTFSRAAAKDAQAKVRRDHPKSGMITKISTLHSLAGKVLKDLKVHNVDDAGVKSISMSIVRLHAVLKEMPEETLKKLGPLGVLTDLFVDEAQDLDDYQYDCLALLQERLNVRLHLVGDPNQCIYQFRNSSSTYLLSAKGKTFFLTNNYRSTKEIVDFTNELIIHPPDVPSQSMRGRGERDVHVFNMSADETKKKIHAIVTEEGTVYSDFAILFPSKFSKDLFGLGASKIYDYLSMRGVPVRRLYSLDGKDQTGYNPKKDNKDSKDANAVTFLTYHSSKGLEFKHVIVMDLHHELMNRRPTLKDNAIHAYLVYVALTRAQEKLDIFTLKKEKGEEMRPTNFSKLADIPPNMYTKVGDFSLTNCTSFKDEEVEEKYSVTEILGGLSQSQVARVHQLVKVTEDNVFDIAQVDYDLDDYFPLRGTFIEQCVVHLYRLQKGEGSACLGVRDFLRFRKVLKGVDKATVTEIEKLRKNLGTWDAIRLLQGKPETSGYHKKCLAIMLDRGDLALPLSQHAFCAYDETTEGVLQDRIFPVLYKSIKLLEKATWENPELHALGNTIVFRWIVQEVGYYSEFEKMVSAVVLALDEDYVQLLKDFVLGELAGNAVEFQFPTTEGLTRINGLADMVRNDVVCEFKCCKENYILEHVVQLWVYGFSVGKGCTETFRLYNFSRGKCFDLTISVTDPFELLSLLCEAGNIKMRRLNLVYDLETNGLHGQPIQICGKEYTRKITVLPQTLIYLEAGVKYDSSAYAVHKISNERLKLEGISMKACREMIEQRLRSVENVVVYAHNGATYDHVIMRNCGLWGKVNIMESMDTLSVIKAHVVEKFESYNLGEMVKSLGIVGDYDWHSAEGDVDALIDIMHKLRIDLKPS